MGYAYLNGSGGGGGIRNRAISSADYEKLSTAEKNNPGVVYIINDMKNPMPTNTNTAIVRKKCCTWDTYQSLSDDDRNDPQTEWLITDKTIKDLQQMGYFANEDNGSRLYNIAAEMDTAEATKLINSFSGRLDVLERAVADISYALTEISNRLNS